MVGTIVLSPLIVIEVVVRAVLGSGSSIVPPVGLLGLSLLFLWWRDRKSGAGDGTGEAGAGTQVAAG